SVRLDLTEVRDSIRLMLHRGAQSNLETIQNANVRLVSWDAVRARDGTLVPHRPSPSRTPQDSTLMRSARPPGSHPNSTLGVPPLSLLGIHLSERLQTNSEECRSKTH